MKIVCECGNVIYEVKPAQGGAPALLVEINDGSELGMKVQMKCTECDIVALKIDLVSGKEKE